MKIKYIRYVIVSFTLSIFAWSCNDTTEPSPQPAILVSSTLVKEYTKDQLVAALGSDQQSFALFVRGGVKQYKLVYKTKNTDGSEIQASGALVIPTIPNLTNALPLASYQHGTIFSDEDAPSYFSSDGEGMLVSLVATLGYIVAAPDYIGFGSSNNLPHPYEHREGLATASLDMIRAAKEFIAKEKINWNKKLYIGGYSEGGYATMALQKKIEEETTNEFDLRASSCGAGAYNKTLSFKTILDNETEGDPSNNATYIWVILTYNDIYKLNRPMTGYFKEPYASQIQKDRQNVWIRASLNTIVTDSFKQGILNNSDTLLLNAIKDNDIFDWKPKTPTQLTHGTADTHVPYANSQTAYDAMIKKGATNVTLNTINNGTHASTIESFLFSTITFFASNQ